MIKDIVVNLSVGEGGSPTGDYAVSVASALKAHLAGIAFAYNPGTEYYSGDPIYYPDDPVVSGTGYIPVEVIDGMRRDNEVAAKVAIDRFAKATSRANVSAEPRASARASPAPVPSLAELHGASISQLSARPSTLGRAKRRLPKARCSIPAGR